MATPTASKQAPSSSQLAATPPVSTPFSASHRHSHPVFSPRGPRSVVPSPQQVKKSPANYSNMQANPSSNGGGGHPTNSSFGVAGYDSPSAAMALGAGVMDLGLDGIGTGVGGIGGSVLGEMGAVRSDEEEKKRKLQAILDILKNKKGRLSEDSIARLSQRLGLAKLNMDDQLVIAGSALEVDIVLANNAAKELKVDFHNSSETVSKHTDKAAKVLFRDLQPGPGESPLTKTLDRFAANLERLATLDKLSILPGLNCHEAIAGVYESLQRLHTWEVSKLREQEGMVGKDDRFLARMAMCTKSGMPVMHTRDRVGLSYDYWQVKHQIPLKDNSQEERKTWALRIECAPMTPLIYPPARVSDKWISQAIQKANLSADEMFLTTEEGPVLDWLEPENTLLPTTEAPKDAMEGIEQASTQKLAEVMFVAKVNPPLVVPYNIAVHMYDSTSVPLDVFHQSTFDGLLFPHNPGDTLEAGEARTIRQETAVPIFAKDGTRSTQIHKNTLFVDKIEYGHTLTELPFSHPRQLVAMLPILRQYAFVRTLLWNTFGPALKQPQNEELSTLNKNKRDEFMEFMTKASSRSKSDLTLDISLNIQPHPRLQVVFPFKQRTANVTFDIKLNGEVEVVTQNILKENEISDGMGEEKMITPRDLGRMLEITENIGVWMEYVKRRLGG